MYEYGSIEYWKKRDISTSLSENVYYFGYTADFNTKKSYKFGPSGSVDVVSFYYDIYESEPILWYSESNFPPRIFEVEKWAAESARLVPARIYLF